MIAPVAQVAAAGGSSCDTRCCGAPANTGTAHRMSFDWSYCFRAAATSGCGGGAESVAHSAQMMRLVRTFTLLHV